MLHLVPRTTVMPTTVAEADMLVLCGKRQCGSSSCPLEQAAMDWGLGLPKLSLVMCPIQIRIRTFHKENIS